MPEILRLLHREPQSRLIDDLSPAAQQLGGKGFSVSALGRFPRAFSRLFPLLCNKNRSSSFRPGGVSATPEHKQLPSTPAAVTTSEWSTNEFRTRLELYCETHGSRE